MTENTEPRLFREANIKALALAINGDQYNDQLQIEAWGEDPPETIAFLNRNLLEVAVGKQVPHWLEVGCGSGRLLDKLVANPLYMIDPSADMLERLIPRLAKIPVNVRPEAVHGYIECLPDMLGMLDAVVFMNGFFQVRSDYEALIEINRVLRVGGRFLFNLLSDDSQDIICGRVLGVKNYIRVAEEFGFTLVEVRADGNIALQKEHDFYPEKLRKLQLKPVTIAGSDSKFYQALNLHPVRDRKLT